jgi:hypothetical protein
VRDSTLQSVLRNAPGGYTPAVTLSLGFFGNIPRVFTTSYHLIDLLPPCELFLQIGITEPVVRILVPEAEPVES